MFKKIIVAATSVSLAASPAIAQRSAAAAAPQISMEDVEGSELRGRGQGRGFIIAPLVALTLIILGILLATGTFPFDDDKDGPRVSP